MNHRIRELRKLLGLTQSEFADKLGLKQSALSSMERNGATEQNIKSICSVYHVNEEWLLTGKGEIFFITPYEKEISEIFNSLRPATQEHLLNTARDLLKLQEDLLNQQHKKSACGTLSSPCPSFMRGGGFSFITFFGKI